MSIILNGNTIAGHTPPQSYRFVGEIFQSAIPINDTKVALLDGHRITSSEGYGQFIQYITSVSFIYPQLACTEEEWQNTVTAYGECGKFVIGDSYVRLPKIVSFVQGLSSLNDLANIVEAGLPNITGDIGTFQMTSLQNKCTGVFTYKSFGTSSYGGASSSEGAVGANFNASLSNPIYGNSDAVQPQAIQYPYYIVLATGVTQNIQVIEEIECNIPHSLGESKYSPITLNNLSWLKSEGQWNPASIHSSFYDWLLREYNNPDVLAKFNKDAFIVVGSPTITEDGVASGFSSSGNYIKSNISSIDLTDNFKISFELTTSSDVTTEQSVWGTTCNNQAFVFQVVTGVFRLYYPTGTGTRGMIDFGKVEAKKTYNITLSCNNGTLTIQDYNKSFSFLGSAITFLYMGSGRYENTLMFTGSIDLKQFSITVDGVKTFSGANSSVKLVTETYDDYDFVLNTTNKTFRLPLLDGSEDLVSDRYETLTDVSSGKQYTATANGWYAIGVKTTADNGWANLNNKTAKMEQHCHWSLNGGGTSANIQASKGDIFALSYGNVSVNYVRFIYAQGNGSLYYYVGETVQNANLINAGRIEEAVVDIKTEMQNTPHIVETYSSGTSWYRVYSDGWCEQGGQVTVANGQTGLVVTLLKPYVDLNYNTQATPNSRAYSRYGCLARNATTSTIEITYNLTSGLDVAWQTKGYIL